MPDHPAVTVNMRDSYNQMTSSRSSLREDFTFRNMSSLPSTSRNSNNLNWSHSASELGFVVENNASGYSLSSRMHSMSQLDNDTLLLLGATHDLICAILLHRSIVGTAGGVGHVLDVNCCKLDGLGTTSGDNVLFSVRDYLDQVQIHSLTYSCLRTHSLMLTHSLTHSLIH